MTEETEEQTGANGSAESAEPMPPPTEENLIDKAQQAAERLENANARLSMLLDKQERLKVKETLGGTAEAGEPQKKEETPKDYAAKVLKGDI